MNPRKPPRPATWLLNYFGLARQNPPLVGDLLEEFREGRSMGWFWRQTLVVILTGFAGNARRFRRLLVARLIGWAAAAGRTTEMPCESLDGFEVCSYGILSVIPTLEFLQHHFS